MYCEEYGFDCSETCCAGIVCAPSKFECKEIVKRSYSEVYIGLGVITFLIVFIPIIVKVFSKCLKFEILKVSICFIISFCICWPCCLCGICCSFLMRGASNPDIEKGGENGEEKEKKITMGEICCMVFCLKGQGMNSNDMNKIHNERTKDEESIEVLTHENEDKMKKAEKAIL